MAIESVETLDLETFLAVTRNGSIAGAAQELRLSSPSVSVRIAALERKLGAQLFDRTSRGSTLTPAGTRFRQFAQRCLDLLADAHAGVRSGPAEPIMIAAPASLGNAVLGPAIRMLHQLGIAANGRVADTAVVIELLLDGVADIGLTVNGVIPRGLAGQRIVRSPIRAVVRPGHPLTADPAALVSVDDLREYGVAVYRWHAEAEALGQVLAETRRTLPVPTVYVGLPPAILDLVAHLDFVGLVGEFAIAEQLRRGEIEAIALDLPVWSVDIDVVYRRDAHHGAATPDLIGRMLALRPLMVADPDRPDGVGAAIG